jgi:Cys-rich protein (TIGR01571 family)
MDVSKQPKHPEPAFHGEDESFIATATAVVTPRPPEARAFVEVVAPATLPEGYTFEAQADGQPFTVTVPMGGVEEGLKFQVPVPSGSRVLPASSSSVPVGHWKDDLCACCGLGCFHPSLCMAYCCPMLLLAQVMTRLKLTWSAQEGGNAAQASSTFRILAFLWIAFIGLQVIQQVLKVLSLNYEVEHGEPNVTGAFMVLLLNLVVMAFSIFFLVITCNTRRHIREKYQIPEQQCHGCEDCCCTYWCTCCTISQMARHTGDYANHGSRWCSETGLPPSASSETELSTSVPSIV